MEKKYILTNDKIIANGKTFYRIVALKNFGLIKIGTLGGYIESEDNLSHEGEAWVYKNARVGGNARIYDDAKVDGNALVFGNSKIHGNAYVFGNACIYGNAEIYDHAHVYGNASVHGNATVAGKSVVCDNAIIFESASIISGAEIRDCVQIYGHCTIGDESYIGGNTHVYGNAEIFEKCIISGNIKIFGCTRLVNAWIESNADFITIQAPSDGSPITFFSDKSYNKDPENWRFTFKQLAAPIKRYYDIADKLMADGLMTNADHKLFTIILNEVIRKGNCSHNFRKNGDHIIIAQNKIYNVLQQAFKNEHKSATHLKIDHIIVDEGDILIVQLSNVKKGTEKELYDLIMNRIENFLDNSKKASMHIISPGIFNFVARLKIEEFLRF